MKSVLLAGCAVAALMAPPAYAAPKTPAAPSYIRVAHYSATRRETIVGVIGDPTTITFPQGEEVLTANQTSVAGKDAAWQRPEMPKECSSENAPKACRTGNNLTMWPAVAGTTYMTVVTLTASGQQKPYAFKLVAEAAPKNGDIDPSATFGLMFAGGQASSPRLADDPEPEIRRVRKVRVAADPPPVSGFWGADRGPCHYQFKGDAHSPIAPLCPIDNGQWIAMRFPGLSDKPAAYIADGAADCGADKGKFERLPRQHVSGDYLVVEQLAPKLCLRLGTNVLEVLNDAYNPAGAPTGTGTTSPYEQRDIIQARATK